MNESAVALCGLLLYMCLTLQAGFESLGIIEEQFPKLLLNGGEAAAPPEGHETDAVGKVGHRFSSFVLLFFAIMIISPSPPMLKLFSTATLCK